MRKTYKEIETLVCSFEQAKKLKALGIKQDSFHYWYKTVGLNYNVTRTSVYIEDEQLGESDFAAFTCAELGVMIPRDANGIHSYYTIGDQMVATGQNGFIVMSYDGQIIFPDKLFETESFARAELIIYLLENNIVTAEQINQQLEQ